MAMYTKMSRVGVWAIEHDIVWSQKLASRHDLEADTEDIAAIYGVRVGVVDLESCDGC